MSVDPNLRTVAGIIGAHPSFCGDTYAVLDLADKIVSAIAPPPAETQHERCVRLALASREVMDFMRDGRKIQAIKELRRLGSGFQGDPHYIGLRDAKDAVESSEVALATLRYKLTDDWRKQ